jgi:hypothetical protein
VGGGERYEYVKQCNAKKMNELKGEQQKEKKKKLESVRQKNGRGGGRVTTAPQYVILHMKDGVR